MDPRQLFMRAIMRSQTEREIAAALMDFGQAMTGADAVGLYWVSPAGDPSEIHTRGAPQRVLEEYEQDGGRESDPVLRWVNEHRAPCEASLADLESPEFRRWASARDLLGIKRYMVAPTLCNENLVGVMCFSSRRDAPLDIACAMTLTISVSARLSVLRALETSVAAWDGALSTRELQIAECAARGLSTAQIATAAGISVNTVKKYLKRIYERLNVASRAELGVVLLRGPKALEPVGCKPSTTSRIGTAQLYSY